MFKFLIVICILSLGLSAQAETTAKKKVKKTVVTTTTEETDENGKVIKKVEKVESESPAESAPAVVERSDSNLPSTNEDWYTLWGLGFGSASYSGKVGDAYEKTEDLPGADRSPTMSMDLLGFYWPLVGHKTMIGFVFNTAGDSIEYTNGTETTVTTSMLGFSAHHFFGENIGDGWFVRGDVGLARASIDIDNVYYDLDDTTDFGLGLLLGGGYAMPIGEETRLLLGLYVRPIPELEFNSSSKIKGTVTTFTAGFLF